MADALELAREVDTPQLESSESYHQINEATYSTETSAPIGKIIDFPTDKTEAPVKVMPIWPPEIQSLVDWFYKFVPPETPFYLEPQVHVLEPVKFIALLRVELEAGPTGPRARMGTIQGDLQKLKAYFE